MDNIDLSRFLAPQRSDFPTALREIRNGRKESHWMWYIFPQIHGLGQSPMALRYAIQSLDEAAAYLSDPFLGGNLREITGALLALPTDDPHEVFGGIDAKKLRSCMTLFALVAEENSVFQQVLDRFFGCHRDPLTLRILRES